MSRVHKEQANLANISISLKEERKDCRLLANRKVNNANRATNVQLQSKLNWCIVYRRAGNWYLQETLTVIGFDLAHSPSKRHTVISTLSELNLPVLLLAFAAIPARSQVKPRSHSSWPALTLIVLSLANSIFAICLTTCTSAYLPFTRSQCHFLSRTQRHGCTFGTHLKLTFLLLKSIN